MSGSRVSDNGHSLWPLRLLALAIAFGVWLFAAYMPRIQEILVPRIEWSAEANVSYSLPEGSNLVVLNSLQTVRLQLRGSDEQQRRLDDRDIIVQVIFDATATPGTWETALTPENVRLPDDRIEVTSISPNRLDLIVDIEEERQMRVVPRFVGEPSAGRLLDHEIEPEEVRVRGPRTMLDQFNVISTQTINLDGHLNSFREIVAVPPPDNSLIRVMQPRTVTVQVNIETPEDLAPIGPTSGR